MAFEHLIAARHLRARSKRSLSVVTWLAVTGVALGVAALVGGFSITSGFEQAFREKVLGITAHVFVREYGIRFTDYRAVQARLAEIPGVKASAPMTFNEAMLSGATGTAGVVVKGIEPAQARAVLDLATYMVDGDLAELTADDPQGVDGIVLGAALAQRLGCARGDLITVISPLRTLDPEAWRARPDAPVSRPFRVRGIFSAGFHEYDTRLAYMALPVAQRFFGTGDAVAGIEVAVTDPLRAGEVAAAVDAGLGRSEYSVLDWRRQNRNLFASLTYQRLAILLVLSVMVVLASCNVAIMLIMLVLERTKEIAILKAMGASDRSILRIFVWEGLGIGALGTAVGMALAFAFCEGLLSNGLSLDPKVYGIARLPVVFEPLDYLLAAGGALLIIFVAAIFPALRGARLAPVDGLRETYG